ncbi:MAG: hypothetical protein SAJ12_24405, partial [Jaaginema sp. PMC 1079.18]|nr:hypothetical protein [Jaaginema sp. PMC 1079.18]
ALGATLIHLLTGIAPSELPQQELKMQFRDRLPASVDSAFAAWLEVMTAIGVKKRYQSTTEALEALQKPQPEITALRRQRRTPKPSPKSATPQARLQKSLDNLQIEIPSPFEVEWLQPGSRFLQRWLERGYDYLQAGVRWYKNLEAMQKKRFTKIVVGLGLLIGFLSATGVLPIVAFVQESAIALLTLAIALLGLVLPLGAIAFWLLQQNRSEYFEKTCVSFYPKYFAVERFSLQNHQRHFGQIAQIQALEITTQRDRHGRLCQGIVVEYNDASPNPHRYFFGENLSPTELEKLRQEIQLWLANISVPTTPESSSDTPQN